MAYLLIVALTSAPGVAEPWVDLDAEVHAWTSAALLGGVGLLNLGAHRVLDPGERCSAAQPQHCDVTGLPRIDRGVVGNDSHRWRLFSDVAVGVLPLAALGALAAEARPGGWHGVWNEAVVLAESLGWSLAVVNVLKFAVRRRRPLMYVADTATDSVDGRVSFPSGHSATAASVSFGYATIFHLRHPNSVWTPAVYALAAGATALTAHGRVAGGRHFYTDIATGALIGIAAGTLVPRWLASTELVIAPSVNAGGMTLMGRF